MANYNTNLNNWGAAGSEPPSGYNYSVDEPPVDDFDNWIMDNVVSDIQHLTTLTNDRVESDKGTSRPSSPESAHLFGDTSTGELEWYDDSSSAWSRALDATGDTMEGGLTLNSGAELSGNLTDDNGNTIFDYNGSHIEQSILQNDSVTINANGSLTGGGNVSLGGSVDIGVNTYSDSEAISAIETNNVSNVTFTDADSDGNNWKLTGNGSNGNLEIISSGGGGTQMDLEHNGNLRIEGQLTEGSAL